MVERGTKENEKKGNKTKKKSRVLQVLEVLGEDSCLMFILQHADSAMGLVFASWPVLANHNKDCLIN